MTKLKFSFGLLVAICAIALTVTTNAKSIFAACSTVVTITNPDPDVVFSQGDSYLSVNQYQGRTDSQLNTPSFDTEACDGVLEEFCCATKANPSAPVVLLYRTIP
ncbi:hypothetical protein [Chitinophaga sp. XS-30]|uniref:hypothetical protein n=1 Tax=Chitinophaga sp. XS-30 TaxID=2604421 RepID=UPI0011DD612C|nr:hypothetical protein [Chitinophaga sp. XS-30]QEH43181.1 hypothetical protein FW415_20840 [Chitinophaga sp. XS-30]